MTRRFNRHRTACFLGWLLCSALYFGTANGVSVRYHDRLNSWHHYEYLVDGFLAGQTHLSRAPDPAMLALADPYDPATNGRYRLGDATLHRGRYYLYFGPTPALLLMLPWKLVTGNHLPQWAATAGFALIGLGAAALLLAGVQRRYFPLVAPVRLFLAVVLVAHVSWFPVVLRRPAFWELPIVCAVALFWWSLFFIWKHQSVRRHAVWALAAGGTLALMPGARPTYAITAGFLLAVFALAPRGPQSWRERAWRLWPLVGPLAAAAVALVAYNYLRFGRVLEFGQSYQLWGEDFRGKALFSATNILVNLRVYFFSLPEISPYFPFLRMAPMPAAGGYLGTEEMPGIFFAMPVVILGLFAVRHAWLMRRASASRPLVIVMLGAGVGGSITGIFLFCFGGGCSRYIAELLAGWSLITGIGWLAWSQRPAAPGRSRLARIAVTGAMCWSLACVWLASFGFHNYARLTQPGLYRALASVLNYPGHWLALAAHREFGPVSLEIGLAPSGPLGDTIVLHTGFTGARNALVVERLAPERVRLRLMINDYTTLATPVMQVAKGARIAVELHAPWLYPPRAHPYWRRFADPVQKQRLQTISVLSTAVVTQVLPYTLVFDATRFEPYARRAGDPSPGSAWIETLRRLDPAKSVAGRDLGVDAPEPLPGEILFPH